SQLTGRILGGMSMHIDEALEELAAGGLTYLEGAILWYLRGGMISQENLEGINRPRSYPAGCSGYTEEEVDMENLDLGGWVRVDRLMDALGQPELTHPLERLEELNLIESKLAEPPRHYMESKKYQLTDWGACLVDSQPEKISNVTRSATIELDTEKLERECYFSSPVSPHEKNCFIL
ncbi:MAG: hypothetical protein V5A79_04880, partial [Candidatus Bipolaricaulota bacterium]